MKNILKILLAGILLILFTGCGKDNYEQPKSMLKGKITYNGEAVNVRGTDERVRLQLYQDGYAKRNPIEVFVTQDGSFSAMLFNGEYKIVTRDNNGPWVNLRDTTYVTVSGTTEVEFKVTPYFTISNTQITLTGNLVNASFTLGKVVEQAKIDRVILLLGNTTFVDDGIRVLDKNFRDDFQPGTINLSVDIATAEGEVSEEEVKDVAKSKSLYGRICVWTSGEDQGVYSPVIQLK